MVVMTAISMILINVVDILMIDDDCGDAGDTDDDYDHDDSDDDGGDYDDDDDYDDDLIQTKNLILIQMMLEKITMAFNKALQLDRVT